MTPSFYTLAPRSRRKKRRQPKNRRAQTGRPRVAPRHRRRHRRRLHRRRRRHHATAESLAHLDYRRHHASQERGEARRRVAPSYDTTDRARWSPAAALSGGYTAAFLAAAIAKRARARAHVVGASRCLLSNVGRRRSRPPRRSIARVLWRRARARENVRTRKRAYASARPRR